MWRLLDLWRFGSCPGLLQLLEVPIDLFPICPFADVGCAGVPMRTLAAFDNHEWASPFGLELVAQSVRNSFIHPVTFFEGGVLDFLIVGFAIFDSPRFNAFTGFFNDLLRASLDTFDVGLAR